jgi:hypothetical protein
MKKFLVLMLVLGIATAANATLELSLNGATNGDIQLQEITIAPSDTVKIDVHSDAAGIAYDAWVAVVGPASGFGLPGNINSNAGPDASITDVARPDHLWVQAKDVTGDIGDEILPGEHFWWELHCEDEGDVIVELKDFQTDAVLDTIIIHQIVPEPMTIALLGLGGLLLRRRK